MSRNHQKFNNIDTYPNVSDVLGVSDSTQVTEVDGSGGTGGGGGGISTLQDAYDNSLNPQIETTTTILQIKEGNVDNAVNVLEIKSNIDTAVFTVNGNGLITVSGEPVGYVKTSDRSDVNNGSTYAGKDAGNTNTVNAYGVTAFGAEALALAEGDSNTAFGAGTLDSVTNGVGNVGIGSYAGNTVTVGINNTLLGREADVTDANAENRISIGDKATNNLDNSCVIGNTDLNAVTPMVGNATCSIGTEENRYENIYTRGLELKSSVSGHEIKMKPDGAAGKFLEAFVDGLSVSSAEFNAAGLSLYPGPQADGFSWGGLTVFGSDGVKNFEVLADGLVNVGSRIMANSILVNIYDPTHPPTIGRSTLPFDTIYVDDVKCNTITYNTGNTDPHFIGTPVDAYDAIFVTVLNQVAEIRNTNNELCIDFSTDVIVNKSLNTLNVAPKTNNTYDLGSTTNRFRDLYLENDIKDSFGNKGFVYSADRTDVTANSTLAGTSAGNRGVSTAAGITAFGANALKSVTDGINNSAFGSTALQNCKDGIGNVASGPAALSGVTSGDTNVGIGFQAGISIQRGNNNICIGSVADVADEDALNRIAIGNNCTSDVDDHCVIKTNCIKPFVAGCDLGTETKNYGDVYTTDVKTNTITSNYEITGVVTLVSDDFSGALQDGGVISGNATYIPGDEYVQLTPESPSTDGQLSYNIALGLDFDITFDIYISNTGGDDGNGFGFFMGDNVPTSNAAITNGWIFNAYTYTPGKDQFLIYNNSALVHAIDEYLIGDINPPDDTPIPIPANQDVPCRVVGIGGNTLQFYINGNLDLTYTFSTPYLANYSNFGFLARCQGVDSAYRIKNLLVTNGSGGSLSGKFNVRLPTDIKPYLSMGLGTAETIKLDNDQMDVNGSLNVSLNIIKDYGFQYWANSATATQTVTTGFIVPILGVLDGNMVSGSMTSSEIPVIGGTTPRLTYNGIATKIFQINVSLSGNLTTNNDESMEFHINKNGVGYMPSCTKVRFDGNLNDPREVSLTCLIELEQNDYIELVVTNLDGTGPLNIECYKIVATQI
jgi:hypothetical protein